MTTPRLLSDRYELGDTLGYGGMSEVHRGLDKRLGRDVAVKVLRADLARDPQFQLRFRREAQNAAALNHPAIVAVYDTGEVQSEFGPLPYIVMEYVDGQTLREIVKTQGPMSQQRVIEVMADVCAALDFSHKHNIIHRDVKPANIMINRAGAVKVMDFGIARALGEGQNVTQTAAVIGTAQYLSPEQARGEAVDARSDVYAAGCVLFELLTGEPPFTGDTPVAVAYQHVREDPRSPSEVNPQVTPALDAIVLKALSKNPANRYQSAAEMRADLVRVRSGQQPLAPIVMSEDERTALLNPARPPGQTRRINGAAPPATRRRRPARRYDDRGGYGDYDDEPDRRRGAADRDRRRRRRGARAARARGLPASVRPATPSQVAVPGVVGQTAAGRVQPDHRGGPAGRQRGAAGVGGRTGRQGHQHQPGRGRAGGGAVQRRPHRRVRARVRQRARALGHERRRRHRAAQEPGPRPRQADQPADQRHHPGRQGRQLRPGRRVRVKGGSTVDIAVGTQQTALTVPDVTGQDKDDAKKTLEAKGFDVDTNTVDGGGQKDTVLSTDPPAGTQAQQGARSR